MRFKNRLESKAKILKRIEALEDHADRINNRGTASVDDVAALEEEVLILREELEAARRLQAGELSVAQAAREEACTAAALEEALERREVQLADIAYLAETLELKAVQLADVADFAEGIKQATQKIISIAGEGTI